MTDRSEKTCKDYLREKKLMKADAELFFHKGLSGIVEYFNDENIYHGKVEGVEDLITFGGATISEARADFENAVNEYLEDKENE